MQAKTMKRITMALIAIMIGTSSAWAAKKKPEASLTEAGKKLMEHYAGMLEKAKAEIKKSLPKIDEADKTAYLEKRQAENKAKKNLKAAQAKFNEINKAQGLVRHAHWWINSAKKNIAKAQEQLKEATTEAERKAAQETIDAQTKRRDAGIEALKTREANLAAAKEEESKLIKERDAAQEALAEAEAQTMKALKDMGLEAFLASDKLDAELAKYVVLSEATPRGLAIFAQEGETQEKLIGKLLADTDLMLQMAVADGAKDGKYGQAMKIYTDIQDASKKAKDGALQRLAVAISLEHAVPIRQQNPGLRLTRRIL